MLKTLAAAASAALLALGSAQAATINLSSISGVNSGQGAATLVGTVTDAAGGTIDILAAAFLIKNGSFVPTYGLKSFNGGLGVDRFNDGHTLDGKGAIEAIVFQAQSNGSSVAVDWEEISFGYFDSKDDFSLFSSSAGVAGLTQILDDINIVNNNPYTFLSLQAATIAVVADYKDDSFKVKSISVDALPSITDPVPVPGALPLMLAGMGGFAALRRRKAG